MYDTTLWCVSASSAILTAYYHFTRICHQQHYVLSIVIEPNTVIMETQCFFCTVDQHMSL